LVEEESVGIGFLGQTLLERGADAVPGAGGTAEENRTIRGRRRLQTRGHFAGLRRVDAALIVACGQQHGRIAQARKDES